MNHGTKFCRLCFKLLLPTILTSSLPFYLYQKDERALPGYLLTRCSFSPSDIKLLSLSPRCFLFTSTLMLSFLTLSLSLSLRLQRVNQTLTYEMFSVWILLVNYVITSSSSSSSSALQLCKRPGLPWKSPPSEAFFVFRNYHFYGVMSASRPTPNLEDQGTPFSLGHHLWPVRQGRPCQYLPYRRHSSQDHLNTQVTPLRQIRDTFGGDVITYTYKFSFVVPDKHLGPNPWSSVAEP
jgi:hypothetical protein